VSVLLASLIAILAVAASPAAAGPATAPSAAVDALRQWLGRPRDQRPDLAAQPFAKSPLTRADAEAARKLLWDDHAAFIREARSQEWKDEAIAVGGHTLRLKERHFGDKPKEGWNLFLSLHGGGGAPKALNDSQWENQIKLYQPPDSLYIAPRAPTDNWNLWHEAHIDDLFDRLIEDAVVLGDVNPNRVYVMGYSAGGDGVYQLAPRMADRWAAASMMAGHPNDASPLGLRNIGFTIHVGALDNGYDRNKVAAQWKQKLDDLQKADPDGYPHEVQLHEGRAHWMNLEDRVAVDWMLKFTRDPLPTKVVWKQSPRTHDRLYWLAVPKAEAKGGQLVVASRRGQHIEVEKAEGVKTLTVLLSDAMMDLDKPVTVSMGRKVLFNGVARRTVAGLNGTLAERGDPDLVFEAAVTVRLEEKAN
jgi:hypothetical protein